VSWTLDILVVYDSVICVQIRLYAAGLPFIDPVICVVLCFRQSKQSMVKAKWKSTL